MRQVTNTIVGIVAIALVCLGFAALRNGVTPETITNLLANESASEEEVTRSLTLVTVSYVKDGDTFVAKDENGTEHTIRLIGVDTPESVAPEEYIEKTGKENTDAGKTASEFTKDLLNEQSVYLELDVQETDTYGRVLAYVWLDEETMVQDVLLREGYANLMTIQPNIKYVDRFTQIVNDRH